MASRSDRRGFFGDFLREAAQVVRGVNEAIRVELGPKEIDVGGPWYEEPAIRAEPTSKPVSVDEVLGLCREVGLEQRSDHVRRLLRPSFRLTRVETPTDAPQNSRLGGIPDLPSGFEWPTWHGRELSFLGQLDVADLAELGPGGDLPPRGLLLFFYDARSQPSGLEPTDRGACRVVHVDLDPSALSPDLKERARFAEYPLELSPELVLPRSWSVHVDSLGLDATELAAWDELRERLARAQGVDLEELNPTWQALHRLLGYPEELGSEMELDCQLASSGLNVREGEDHGDPRRDQLEAGAAEWRLLLQLSDDDDLGASWGEGFGRLYFWIREDELRSHDYNDVWAILR